MPDRRFRLTTLGGLALLTARGEPEPLLGTRTRKLALLAVLALERRPLPRDRLAEMFWGDHAEDRAKHSLSDALSHYRRVLGPRSLRVGRSDVALATGAPLAVDALELLDAAADGGTDRVLSLYAGPFLDGVFVTDAESFDHWADQQRAHLHHVFTRSCELALRTLREGERWRRCVEVAERWLDAEPASRAAALALLDAAAASDTADRAHALDVYARTVRRLREEFELLPPEDIAARAAALGPRRARDVSVAEATAPSGTIAPPAPALGSPESSDAPRPPPRHRAMAAWGLAAVFVGGISLARYEVQRERASPIEHAAFVLTPFGLVAGDTSADWLREGVPRLIAARLTRSPSVDAVVPDMLFRHAGRAPFGKSVDMFAIARGFGARWVASGAVTQHDSVILLEVLIRDAASRRLVRRIAAGGPRLFDVANEVGLQLLELADAEERGASFGDVETSSVEAFEHYVRALRAFAEGHFGQYRAELDASVALDSSFIAAVRLRMEAAQQESDLATLTRLDSVVSRHGASASDWDRLSMETLRAFHRGQHAQSDALALDFVRRFPRDPRVYDVAVNVLWTHGRWRVADSLLRTAAVLDSVVEAHGGECDGALAAAQRARALSGGEPEYDERLAEILIVGRRLDAAESLAATLARPPRRSRSWSREAALDIQLAVERERGQYSRSVRTAARLASDSAWRDAVLVEGNSLARAGRFAEAARLYEAIPNHPAQWDLRRPAYVASVADAARSFTWHHTLLAAALAARCDTAWLGAMADSLGNIGSLSYFGRDWALHHHVRGLRAMCEHRFAAAEAEFERARWTTSDWAETLVWLARARLALGRPRDAVAALRDAYASIPEGMERYVPRTELDFDMARALAAAGERDSARVYGAYVSRAWRAADPCERARLDSLLRTLR